MTLKVTAHVVAYIYSRRCWQLLLPSSEVCAHLGLLHKHRASKEFLPNLPLNFCSNPAALCQHLQYALASVVTEHPRSKVYLHPVGSWKATQSNGCEQLRAWNHLRLDRTMAVWILNRPTIIQQHKALHDILRLTCAISATRKGWKGCLISLAARWPTWPLSSGIDCNPSIVT